MGRFSKSDIRVEFETQEQSDKFFKLMSSFQENVQKHYSTVVNPEYVDTVNTDVSDIELFDNEVTFELRSGRERNMEWQMEYVTHFLKEVGGLVEINSSTWVESDMGICFEDQEELDDYTPNLS